MSITKFLSKFQSIDYILVNFTDRISLNQGTVLGIILDDSVSADLVIDNEEIIAST